MAAADEEGTDEQQAEPAAATDLPPMDFNIFVLSLNTSALIQLGEAPDADGSVRTDLPMARQTIDLLGMLEDKTKGNLTGQEERLLHQVLFDLRMRFSGKAGSGP